VTCGVPEQALEPPSRYLPSLKNIANKQIRRFYLEDYLMTRFSFPSACAAHRFTVVLLLGSALSSPAYAATGEAEVQASPATQPQNPPASVRAENNAPLTLAGSRSQENAVRQASDAFGTVVGREAVGLYNAELERRFSPLRAGNVRLDGLYFDTVIEPTDRTSGAINILADPSAIRLQPLPLAYFPWLIVTLVGYCLHIQLVKTFNIRRFSASL
jgi:hypothetical protein